MKIFKRNILIYLVLLIVTVAPVLVGAQNTQAEPSILPNCGEYQECGYNDLLRLVNNIIKWVIFISVPVAAGVFAWAGLQMMLNANNPGKRDESKAMMWSVAKGLAFILAAWIIISTVLNALLKNPGSVPIDITP